MSLMRLGVVAGAVGIEMEVWIVVAVVRGFVGGREALQGPGRGRWRRHGSTEDGRRARAESSIWGAMIFLSFKCLYFFPFLQAASGEAGGGGCGATCWRQKSHGEVIRRLRWKSDPKNVAPFGGLTFVLFSCRR